MLPMKDLFQIEIHTETESEGIKKKILCKLKQKAKVAIIISDKIDFKLELQWETGIS